MRCWILATMCLAAGCAQSTTKPVAIDFAADPLGRSPPRFSQALTGDGAAGTWIVRAAPDGGHVLAQESADAMRTRKPLCIYDGFVGRDVSASVRCRALDGLVGQAGGLVLRYRPGNYYLARVDDLRRTVALVKVVDGTAVELSATPVALKPNAWHGLRFTARGEHLSVALDGAIVIEADDATIGGVGKVGVSTAADTVGAFDDLTIEPLP